MCLRNFLQRVGPKDSIHLPFKCFCKQSIDVVVTIIDKHKATVFDILLEILFFLGGKLYQLVAAEVAEGAPENIIAAERHYVFVGVNFERSVFDERVEHVHRHALVYIPIARFVLQAGKEKTVIAGVLHSLFSLRLKEMKITFTISTGSSLLLSGKVEIYIQVAKFFLINGRISIWVRKVK